MIRAVPLRLLVLGFCLLPVMAGQRVLAQVHAESGADVAQAPMTVLSDTWEYCTQLERNILARPARSADVTRLVREGHMLCDHGQIRVGISRLRRALMLQKHAQDVLPPP